MSAGIRFPSASVLAGLVVIVMTAAVHAQSAGDLFSGLRSNSRDPIQVDAASLEIIEDGDQRISIFDGDVIVRRGNTTLRASTIKLYSNRSGGENSFSRIEATGKVYVNSGSQTVTGSRAVVDAGAQTITLTGDVKLSQGDNIITGDRLVVDMATGHARVEHAEGNRIRGLFTPNGDGR